MIHFLLTTEKNQKPAGDVILSVNGKPTLGMAIAELSAMIQSRPSVQFVIDQKDSMGPRKLVMHRDFPDETLGVQLSTVLMITDLMVRHLPNEVETEQYFRQKAKQ